MPGDEPLGSVRAEQPLPTGRSEDETFDLIYAYAVFSHLSEASHLAWLEEFERILKPGGVFVATTLLPALRRELQQARAAATRSRCPSGRGTWRSASRPRTNSWPPYDRGDYSFAEIDGAEDDLGFASISEQYVRRRWAEQFEVTGRLPGPRNMQMFIVCRKRGQPSNV